MLAEVCREQRRLAYYAPATALGINMHLYWVGLAADLWRQGDRSLEWLLKEAMAGEVFNAGHSERGNDLPVLLSTSKAERVDGGFRFTGHKMFGSLMPVWTRCGLHATWADAEGGPKIVHAFMPRSHDGWRIGRDLGHDGHARDPQRRHGARRRLRSRQVHRADRAGRRRRRLRPRHVRLGADGLRATSITAWRSARWISRCRRSRTRPRSRLSRSMAYHPEIQHAVAEMVLAFDPIGPHLDRVAEDWSNGVDHGAAWPAKIVSAKVPCRRGVLADRRHGDGGLRRRRHVPRPTSWSGCSATRAAAASIRPTPCWCTRSSARPRSASTSANSRAGGKRPPGSGLRRPARGGANSTTVHLSAIWNGSNGARMCENPDVELG